ncbi:MAG: NigD-like protein [Parabacteroides sp.]|nr:NigD-like protein [Parabacteroides sp.]
MKRNSVFLALISILLPAALFTSCNDDGYSLDKFWVSAATVKPLSDNQYYLQLDDGTTLLPLTASGNPSDYPVKQTRVVANYTILGDSVQGYSHGVMVNLLLPILTKDITVLTAATKDSLGSDPVRILDYAIADDYLNIHFAIPTAYGSVHFLNLARNEIAGNPNEYVFTHNAYQTGGPLAEGLIAFDLRTIKETATSPYTFTVKAQDAGGEEKDFSVTYSWDEKNNRMFSVIDKHINYNNKMKVR